MCYIVMRKDFIIYWWSWSYINFIILIYLFHHYITTINIMQISKYDSYVSVHCDGSQIINKMLVNNNYMKMNNTYCHRPQYITIFFATKQYISKLEQIKLYYNVYITNTKTKKWTSLYVKSSMLRLAWSEQKKRCLIYIEIRENISRRIQ